MKCWLRCRTKDGVISKVWHNSVQNWWHLNHYLFRYHPSQCFEWFSDLVFLVLSLRTIHFISILKRHRSWCLAQTLRMNRFLQIFITNFFVIICLIYIRWKGHLDIHKGQFEFRSNIMYWWKLQTTEYCKRIYRSKQITALIYELKVSTFSLPSAQVACCTQLATICLYCILCENEEYICFLDHRVQLENA